METTATVEFDSDFDLDVRIVEDSSSIAELMRDTSDNCGSTCGTACTSCGRDV